MLLGKYTIVVTVWLNTQNRLSKKDGVAANLDYEINLRAELEIIRLHKKMDDLTSRFVAPRKVRDVTNL